jgi:hypothetical protein
MSISSLSQRFSNYFLGPVDRYLFTEKLRSNKEPDKEFKEKFISFQSRIIEIVMTRQDTYNHENSCRTVCSFIDDIILGRMDYFRNNDPLYETLKRDESLQEKITSLFPNGNNIHRINAQDLKDLLLKRKLNHYNSNPNLLICLLRTLNNKDHEDKFYHLLQSLIKDPNKNYDLSKIEDTVKQLFLDEKNKRFSIRSQDGINESLRDPLLFEDLSKLDLKTILPEGISKENFEYIKKDLISCISTPKFIKEIVEWKKTTLIESIGNKITELKRESEGKYDFNQIKNTLKCFFQESTEQTNTDNIYQTFLDDLKRNHPNDLAQILGHPEPDFKKTASTYFMLEILTPNHKELPKQKAEFLDQIRAEVENRLNQNDCTSLQLKNALLYFFAYINPSKSNDELPQDYDHPFYTFLLQHQSELFNAIEKNSLDDINTVASELSEKALKCVDIEIKEHKDKLISDVKNKIKTAKNLHELEIIQNSFHKFVDRYKLKLDPNNKLAEDAYNDKYINDEKKVKTDPNLLNTLLHEYSAISLSVPDL